MARRAWAVAVLLAAAQAASAQAPDVAALAGEYCLVGVREVGSCLRLQPDGRFQYFLAYGAYDENSEGTWKLDRGEVVLDSPAYDKPATFAFKRVQRGTGDAYDIIVEAPNGRPIAGVDVRATCDGRTFDAGVTQAQGYSVECHDAPTAIALGLRMFDVAFQTIDVSGRARRRQGLRVRVRSGRPRAQEVCRPPPSAHQRQPCHDLPRHADPGAQRTALPLRAAVAGRPNSNTSRHPGVCHTAVRFKRGVRVGLGTGSVWAGAGRAGRRT